VIGLGQSLLHLQRQLLLELWHNETECDEKCAKAKHRKPNSAVTDTKKPRPVSGV
jgi:hypothetical protein